MLSNGINWFLRSVLLVRFPTRWLTAPAPALPLSPRGSRNTPFSSRLYHSTKPSRSHARIFNRSPRRERNTNRCPLSACPSLPPPARCARLAPHRAPANSAAPSRRFHHPHQHPHLLGITASPHHQAPPVPQPYLHPRRIRHARLQRAARQPG